MIKTTAQKIYLGLIFIFLYAPIVTLIVLSFNASKTRAKWGGFTTNGMLPCSRTNRSCRLCGIHWRWLCCLH